MRRSPPTSPPRRQPHPPHPRELFDHRGAVPTRPIRALDVETTQVAAAASCGNAGQQGGSPGGLPTPLSLRRLTGPSRLPVRAAFGRPRLPSLVRASGVQVVDARVPGEFEQPPGGSAARFRKSAHTKPRGAHSRPEGDLERLPPRSWRRRQVASARSAISHFQSSSTSLVTARPARPDTPMALTARQLGERLDRPPVAGGRPRSAGCLDLGQRGGQLRAALAGREVQVDLGAVDGEVLRANAATSKPASASASACPGEERHHHLRRVVDRVRVGLHDGCHLGCRCGSAR